MRKQKQLYSMRAIAALIGKVDSRLVRAEAHRLNLEVMNAGSCEVVSESHKDRLLQHFVARRELANAS